MNNNPFDIMNERFRKDNLIGLATVRGGLPQARTVDAYYEDGCFYVVTDDRSLKMRDIEGEPRVAVCGDWFTGHGIAENMGHVLAPDSAPLMERVREAFAAWYGNGHVDESSPHTCLLCVRLTDGVLFADDRYELDFTQSSYNI